MNIIEKFGLVFMIVSVGVGNGEVDLWAYISFVGGLIAFLYGDVFSSHRKSNICSECGTVLEKGSSICRVCGTPNR